MTLAATMSGQNFTRHDFVNADNKYVSGGYVCTRCKTIVSDDEHARLSSNTAHSAVACQEVSIAQVMEGLRARFALATTQPVYA